MEISFKRLLAPLILAVISFISATIITVEKLAVLANPQHIPSCSINPLLSCSPVMASWQASLFGIPNPIVGMVGFGVAITILFLGMFVKFPKWIWVAFTIGIALSAVFIGWLISQSLFAIGALCIYCMIVWACTVPLLWLSVSNLSKGTRFDWVDTYKGIFIAGSYVAIVLLIFFAFQDYWTTLIG